MADNASLPITVVVLARNEAANLPRCLSSVSFASQTVVIDDHSTDDTADVACAFGATVYEHAFRSFADQRNWGMTHQGIHNEWVLHLDADECVTPELEKAIRQEMAGIRRNVAGFFLCFKTILGNRWLKHSSTFPVWVLRLVNKTQVRYVEEGHGERFEMEGEAKFIREPFLHYNFSKGWTDWFEKHNRYSSDEAAEGIEELNSDLSDLAGLFALRDPVRRRAALKRLSVRLPFRPTLRFLYMYLWRKGFLDGRPGLTYCRLLAMYEYMIVLKMRELKACESSATADNLARVAALREKALAGANGLLPVELAEASPVPEVLSRSPDREPYSPEDKGRSAPVIPQVGKRSGVRRSGERRPVQSG